MHKTSNKLYRFDNENKQNTLLRVDFLALLTELFSIEFNSKIGYRKSDNQG